MHRRLFAGAIAVLATLAIASPAVAAPPANDTYSGRELLLDPLPIMVMADTTEATTDADDAELDVQCGASAVDASVWYEYTPTLAGDYEINTLASDYSVGAIVAIGGPGGWTLLSCGPGTIPFTAIAGETYAILIFDDQTDGGGNGGYLEFSIAPVVPNEPPVADPNGPYLGAVGAAISFDGTRSSDPEGDTLTYDWDWGDGTSSTDVGSTPTHTYDAAGIYDVCLTVTDPSGASGRACTSAVVYDPSAGFVTGGGWIDSVAGAYVPDPTLTGKATFGFVSKYTKGAATPTGNTEFVFQTADLNFHATSYDWLVVTGSDYARYKGIGTINGTGDYKFLLWAGDNDPDTFRIKIWTEDAAGVEAVVYDNGMDQPISGGSIVVHTKR